MVGLKEISRHFTRIAGACVFVAAATSLAGCMTSAEIARMNAENDRMRCESYGFKAKSEAFAKCLYDLDKRRDEDRAVVYSRPMGPPVFMPPPGACWSTPWGWRCDAW